MGKAEYLAGLRRGWEQLKNSESNVLVVHHNDADGLSSAAILQKALERASFKVRTLALERVHPPIVERIHDRFNSTIVYVDLGGRAAPVIAAANRGRHLTLILDHHVAEDVSDPTVLNLSTELYGLSGDREISAATAAYLFALQLDEANEELAYLGVVGAIGDSHDRGGRLVGENREALQAAVERGDVTVEETDGKERYTLKRFGDALPLNMFARELTTLGAVGYYLDGPKLGIQACLEGPSEVTEQKLQGLKEIQERAFSNTLEELGKGGLRQTPYVQWFHVHDGFAPMGVKVIGEFCMQIRDKPFVDPQKYLAGFQNMPQTIPELGEFNWELVKVSLRIPSPLEVQIVRGEKPGLSYLVPEAAKAVDGSIDACHDYAGAALIPAGEEERFITKLNELIEGGE